MPVFVVSGMSKIAGLPQMKAAWIAVTGPEREQALERLEVIADTFLSMNAPVQWALPAWLAGRSGNPGADSRSGWRRTWRAGPETGGGSRRRAAGGRGRVVRSVRIPALEPDEQTVLALLERGVWVHPGYFFGMPESGWLVVSLLAPEPEFSAGVGILINYFRTNQGSNTTRDVTISAIEANRCI